MGFRDLLGISLFHILALGGEPLLQCGERSLEAGGGSPEEVAVEVDLKGRERGSLQLGVNLALAYTELTEELGRLRELSSLQGRILRTLLQEQARNAGQRHSPLSQRHSPAPACPSPSPPARPPPCAPCQSPAAQRRSPVPPCPSPQQRRSPASPSCPSPVPQRRSPVPPSCQSPSPQRRSPVPPSCPAPQPRPPPPPGERTLAERAYAKPPSHHAKAGFQGRRSYSELAEGAAYAGASPAWLQAEAATLPKPRAYGELYGPGRPLSPRRAFEGIRLRFEKQPSEEEEWAMPASPPSPEAGTIRCASFCAGFPIPESPAANAYAHAEHAQSWPSINLLMETVGSDIRSCPLCQLGFPVGYPDDALIKHIDSHLENSKI